MYAHQSSIPVTAYGQNITTATTGKYIITVPPTRRAGDSQVGEGAPRDRAAVEAYLNCWIDVRWNLVRARADKMGDRAIGDMSAVLERCVVSEASDAGVKAG